MGRWQEWKKLSKDFVLLSLLARCLSNIQVILDSWKLLVLNNMCVALRVKAGPESWPCGLTYSSLHDAEEVQGTQAVRSCWQPSWGEPA